MTKLEALNEVLDGVGVRPVTEYESAHPDASPARRHLNQNNEEIQSVGWWCNREKDFSLPPDAITKKILLPSNTLHVNPVNKLLNYVKRGKYLYDADGHTFEFDAPVVVHLTTQLDFEDLPIPLQRYIVRTATYTFSVSREGDQNKIKDQAQQALMARSLAYTTELKMMNYNAMSTRVAARLLGGINPVSRR